MSDAQANRRRDQARDSREAWYRSLRPKVSVRPGSHRVTVDANRRALAEREKRERGTG